MKRVFALFTAAILIAMALACSPAAGPPADEVVQLYEESSQGTLIPLP